MPRDVHAPAIAATENARRWPLSCLGRPLETRAIESPPMAAARPTLYLVDAMSNIHRAYHAIQRLSTSAGRPTNAIYGFVTMLRKMLRERTPDYLAVAWDGPERTARHEAYAGLQGEPARDGGRPQRPSSRRSAAFSTPTGSPSSRCPATRPTT